MFLGGGAVARVKNPSCDAWAWTYRSLLNDVEDGDGQLSIGEGVRFGVDFGHFLTVDLSLRREGENESEEEWGVASVSFTLTKSKGFFDVYVCVCRKRLRSRLSAQKSSHTTTASNRVRRLRNEMRRGRRQSHHTAPPQPL